MKDILLVTVFLFSGFLVAHAADDGPMTFEMLKKGKDIVEENCIDCHELDWPMKKITDRAGWEKILTMMGNTGAVLDEEDRKLVLEYLLAKTKFQTSCKQCHGIERALEKNQEFQAWMGTVRRMVGKKPGLLTKDEIRDVAGFLAAKGAETALY